MASLAMRNAAWVIGGFLTLGSVACGGGASGTGGAKSPGPSAGGWANESTAAAPPTQPGSHGSADGSAKADSPSSAPRSVARDSAASAPSTAGALSDSGSRLSERRERPGLGTEWGESRSSRIREMSFERDSSDPPSVLALHYNDRDGVKALASFRDARPLPAGGVTALGGAVRVTLEGEQGEPLQASRVADRTVVLGRAGERYTIVMTNRTGRRFEAVASVDGLDVMTGRPASFDQRGYILLPFATVRIEGFRQSERAVAAFRFSKVADSYAAQTGSARNVGVIGVAFFRERNDTPWPEGEVDFRDTASPFPNEPNRFAQPPR